MGEEYKREIVVMGSVPTLGPVDLYDDMEGVLKWTGDGDGADWTVEKLSTDAFNGNACLHLKTRTTSPAADDGVTAKRSFYQRPGKRYRMEMIWKHGSLATSEWVRFQFLIDDGVDEHIGGVMCSVQAERWYYIRYDGGTALLDDPPILPQALMWHRMAFTFDENTGLYGQLTADGQVVDMSDLKYFKTGVSVPTKAEVTVGISSAGATPPDMYVDDLLILER